MIGSALIEQLLRDRRLRAELRRESQHLEALETRESRSPLSGVLSAAAVELSGAFEPPSPASHTGVVQALSPVRYPGDDAPRTDIAAWMAAEARRHGLPGELPVMAALVESDMQNLPNGDRASVGYFQMQTTYWLDQYPGYPDRPEIQLRWFIDQALAVRRADPELASDPARWGEWVARIERPDESLRWKYGDRLDEARALVAPASPTPGPEPGTARPAPAVSALQTGSHAYQADDPVERLKREAERIDDAQVPYLWGGGHAGRQLYGSPVTPLDCSGAVSRVLGIDPRVSGGLMTWGEPGPGERVTIYANEHHVLMEIDGHFWGTSGSNPGGGAGWIPREVVSDAYLAAFTVRHPAGM